MRPHRTTSQPVPTNEFEQVGYHGDQARHVSRLTGGPTPPAPRTRGTAEISILPDGPWQQIDRLLGIQAGTRPHAHGTAGASTSSRRIAQHPQNVGIERPTECGGIKKEEADLVIRFYRIHGKERLKLFLSDIVRNEKIDSFIDFVLYLTPACSELHYVPYNSDRTPEALVDLTKDSTFTFTDLEKIIIRKWFGFNQQKFGLTSKQLKGLYHKKQIFDIL